MDPAPAGASGAPVMGELVRWFDVAYVLGVEATPAPSPEPAPVPPEPVVVELPPAVVPQTDIEELVCSYAWPCSTALNVMWCESGGRSEAVSWDGRNYGLFQLNVVHAASMPGFWEQWMEPAWNVSQAFSLWTSQGWRPWACA